MDGTRPTLYNKFVATKYDGSNNFMLYEYFIQT